MIIITIIASSPLEIKELHPSAKAYVLDCKLQAKDFLSYVLPKELGAEFSLNGLASAVDKTESLDKITDGSFAAESTVEAKDEVNENNNNNNVPDILQATEALKVAADTVITVEEVQNDTNEEQYILRLPVDDNNNTSEQVSAVFTPYEILEQAIKTNDQSLFDAVSQVSDALDQLHQNLDQQHQNIDATGHTPSVFDKCLII